MTDTDPHGVTPPAATPQPGFLWAEDVAALAGVKRRTVHFYAAQTKRRRAAGQHRLSDLPLPEDTVSRTITVTDGSTRTVTSPRWRESDITLWMANRVGPQGRPREQATTP